MGKSKRKDRTHRKTVDQHEEKRKMRESVLKVFRTRAHSPGGGGALLVNEASNKAMSISEAKNSSHSHKTCNARDFSWSSSDLEAEGGTDSQRESRKRKRHRKTVTGKESRSVDGVKHRGLDRTDGVGYITRGRLTRNVGLFNPGRKSSTVVRDPVPVPESVQQDVDKTLRQILHYDEKCDNSPAPSASPQNSSGKLSDSDHFSSTDLNHIFPKIPPVHDIASGMLSELDMQCRKNFKNREPPQQRTRSVEVTRSNSDVKTPGSGLPPSSSFSHRHHSVHSLSQGSAPLAISRGSTASDTRLNVFPTKASCVSSERSRKGRDDAAVRRESSSMELQPCLVNTSDLGINDSAICLLQCNAMMSKISSLCDTAQQRTRNVEVTRSYSDVKTHGSGLPPSSPSQRHHSVHSLSQGSAPLGMSCGLIASDTRLNVFPTKASCVSSERSRKGRDDAAVRRESSSMELQPCLVNTSDLGISDSAISLLQCNAMMSKISSLCGGRDSSRISTDEQRRHSVGSDHNFHQNHSQSAHGQPSGYYCTNSVRMNAQAKHFRHDSFLDKVMGGSNTHQTSSQHYLGSTDHRCSQPQHAISEAHQDTGHNHRSHDAYYRSQWCLSDVLMDGSRREDTDSLYSSHYGNKPTHCPSTREVLNSDTQLPDYKHHDLLDQLDCDTEAKVKPPHTWSARKRNHGDCRMAETLTRECNSWGWGHSEMLPPLHKPLNTPSPPEKLSLHRLY
ncbi:hypothetical protein BaRGS_00032940 [Batillaria attramentaria]|uniref:Uncharacterized protein n=1 Tax=Batillaria attramentaria TaxID=370345 RepID=A0ABD0JLT4_9CAEN